MTIQNNPTRNQYTATGGQTVFNYNFEIISTGDISVFKGDTRLAISTDYTLTGVGNESGGTVTLVVGATTGDIITIYRSTAQERLTDYQNSGDFLSDEVNADFDRIWAVIQEIDGGQGRYLQLSDTTTSSLPVTLDEPIASQILRWKDDSSGVESVSLGAISPGSSVATDFCIYKTNYNAVRSIDVSEVVDGQTLTVTDESIGGQGVLRNVVGHGLTNTGRVIVIDADWYWYRINGGPTQLKWLAVEGGADETANVQTVIDYVRLTGGVLDISGNYNVTSVSLDLSNGIALTGRGSLVGIATVATDAVLTVKNVVNVAIDGAWFINGNYNTNYSEAVWVYTDGVGQQAAFIDITNLTPVNTRLAWKFGNPNRPQDLVSEITIRGGHTFGCPSAVEAHGAQTVVNFVGCNLASLTGSGDAAWQALPQRTIVSHGATINIVGGELLHVLLSTGGTGGDFNALCVSSAFDLGGGSSQYGKILVNGAVVECGSRFAVSENTAALPTPDSGYIGFVGCQGVSTNTTLAIAETDASYAGTIRFSNNEFFASNPRAVSNVIAGNDGCDIYVDEGSFGDKFLTGLSTIIGGTVHFSNRLIGYYSNVAGQSVPNASATVLAFTDERAGNDLSRFNGSHTAGVFTVPVGGLKSVFVKAQFLLAGLTTANSEFYIQLNGLSVGVSKNDTYQDGSVFLGDLSAGDTIRVVMQNSAAGALTAGSNATDFMQISASN